MHTEQGRLHLFVAIDRTSKFAFAQLHEKATRRIALNLARADSTLKASPKGKRKYAGWDDSFMAALMAG